MDIQYPDLPWRDRCARAPETLKPAVTLLTCPAHLSGTVMAGRKAGVSAEVPRRFWSGVFMNKTLRQTGKIFDQSKNQEKDPARKN
jgi:hypothetical protein